MTVDEIREIQRYLTDAERAELDQLLAVDLAKVPWRPLPGPQTMAYESEADIVGYGGAAGGGKTDLIAGLVLTKHKRALIARREKAQTEGVVQRLTEIIGATDGYNSQKGAWRIDADRLVEFAGLDNPGDERRWQGRPHDLKAFDEVTEQREHQVRFVMGWCRTADPTVKPKTVMVFNPPTTTEGRWVIDFFGPWLDKKHPRYPAKPGELIFAAMLPQADGTTRDVWLDDGRPFVLVNGKPCYDFDPDEYAPEDVIQPKSRTFIPARLTDNPYYMASGYMSTLQALPEPLRSQMLYGDFQAGMKDDPWQVIPTAWVEAAMARWTPKSPRGEMLGMGVDVARGGDDNTVIATRHADGGEGLWFDTLKVYAGKETPDGPHTAGLVIAERRDAAPVAIDVIGVGSSPYDVLNGMDVQVMAVNMAEAAPGTDRSGTLRFFNVRSMIWWRLREALDPANDTGIALPNDRTLLAELCMPKWKPVGKVIQVESREDIVKRLGRSPDRATAVALALIDIPKIGVMRRAGMSNDALNYDPLANIR